MIFVDTGAWYALFVPEDRDHAAADAWLSRNDHPLCTTDYIVDELLTLLRARGQVVRAVETGITLFAEDTAHLVWVTPEDVRGGWDYFRGFEDKGWSFTDCVSRAVIERLGIHQAFAFDKHFHQFGSVEVVP